METAVGTRISFFALLLIGVMAGLVVLLVRKNRRVSIYVGIGLVLVVVGGVFLYKFTGDTLSEKYAAEVQLESISQQASVRRESYSLVDPIWQVTVENEFEADLYPSLETAAKALGQKIAPQVTSRLDEESGVSDAFIMTYGSGQMAELESQAAETIRRELLAIIKMTSFDLERISQDEKRIEASIGVKELVITVRIPTWRRVSAPWTRTARQQTDGTLQVSMQYENEELVETAQFIEKPWVTNFSLFSSQEPGGHYFIAQSMRPCTSASEARYQAMEDASEQLAYRIVEHAGRYRQQFNLGKRSRWKLEDIQALVRTELEGSQSKRYQEAWGSEVVSSDVFYVNQSHSSVRGKYISDRFVQGFQRPYGAKIWREALLVDASKENVDTLAGLYADTLREKRESWLKIALSALGMLVLVCVVYVFLNSATKGYYTAALRAAAVVLAIVIIGIAWVLA